MSKARFKQRNNVVSNWTDHLDSTIVPLTSDAWNQVEPECCVKRLHYSDVIWFQTSSFTCIELNAFIRHSPSRRVASQFFLVSPDLQVDEALAESIIFQIIFFKVKMETKKRQNFFLQWWIKLEVFQAIPKGLNRSSLSGQWTSPRTKAKKERYIAEWFWGTILSVLYLHFPKWKKLDKEKC